MQEIRQEFRQRSFEVAYYLTTLRFLEDSGAELVARNGQARRAVDTTTRHVLKGSVFLHLYNLVESTVTACLARVADEIRDGSVVYERLAEEWRMHWLDHEGRAGELLSQEKRIQLLLEICEHVVGRRAIDFRPSLPGGNLDDRQIEKVARQFGVPLAVRRSVEEGVKRHVVDDEGTLGLICRRRNELAHGESSFGDCGRSVSVRDLRTWAAAVVRYLRELIRCFAEYLEARGFERSMPP